MSVQGGPQSAAVRKTDDISILFQSEKLPSTAVHLPVYCRKSREAHLHGGAAEGKESPNLVLWLVPLGILARQEEH